MKKNKKEKKNGNPKKQVIKDRFNRIDSAVATLQQSGPISREKWIEKADQLYTKHGGSSNTKESEWAVRHSHAVMKALNMIEEKDGAITLKK